MAELSSAASRTVVHQPEVVIGVDCDGVRSDKLRALHPPLPLVGVSNGMEREVSWSERRGEGRSGPGGVGAGGGAGAEQSGAEMRRCHHTFQRLIIVSP